MNRTIFSKLLRLHLISPRGICRLIRSFACEGISLMALLRFTSIYYPGRCALVSSEKRFSFKELYDNARRLAQMLHADYGLKAGMCVGLMCRNHALMALLLPALSRLGVNVKLINTDIAPNKVTDLVGHYHLGLLVYDDELEEKRVTHELPCPTKKSEDLYHEVMNLPKDFTIPIPRIKRGGLISVFTGGSSGKSKEATRKLSVFQYLQPFRALLQELRIDEYDSVLLPLPVYHGFGLATLITSLVMGKKVCLMNHFNADEALKIISHEEIEVLSVVPAMLARLWLADNAPELMKTVKCIICGGDRLDKKWVDITQKHLGDVLFNLFGTSEAGFFMIASPDDLSRYEEVTIGRPIRGVKCKVEQMDSHGVGSLWVCSGWAMMSAKDKWQDTGDLVYRNADGCYFYRGRSDNMVVCGGENVYPENVEKIINSHPQVLTSMVYPAPDSRFGSILNATVELKSGATSTPEEIKAWLHTRLSRAEMPHDITISAIATLETGKMSRRRD